MGMGKRGPKPKGKVEIKWSRDFAYAIGLIVTDGNLSQKGSRITFVSKDLEQVENFKKCLKLKNKIGVHHSGSTSNKAHRVQFGDVLFFEFLNSIGIFPAKSKTIGTVQVPDEHFLDFLRGSFDGDGTIHSYFDPRWKSSFMFYTIFCSASKTHIDWLRSTITRLLGPKGHITKSATQSVYQLKYAKRESLILLRKIYKDSRSIYLSRKKLKVMKILGIVGESLEDKSNIN